MLVFLDASCLVDAVFGIIDFLEFLLSRTAHVLTQCSHLVGMMFQCHLAISSFHSSLVAEADAENAVGIIERAG